MRRRSIGWALAFLGLVVFAIPWFLWGQSGAFGGLPVWVWWHVGWLVLASAVFWQFARTDWGLWIVDGQAAPRGDDADGSGDRS